MDHLCQTNMTGISDRPTSPRATPQFENIVSRRLKELEMHKSSALGARRPFGLICNKTAPIPCDKASAKTVVDAKGE